MSLGVRSRLVAIETFALHLSFVHRGMIFLFGFDLVVTFFPLHLCLADRGVTRGRGRSGRSWARS